MGFLVVGSNSTIHNDRILRLSHVELEKNSPRCTQEMKPLGYAHVRPYIRRTCYPAVSGGKSVIRLSLRTSKQVVNLLQMGKRTYPPLIP